MAEFERVLAGEYLWYLPELVELMHLHGMSDYIPDVIDAGMYRWYPQEVMALMRLVDQSHDDIIPRVDASKKCIPDFLLKSISAESANAVSIINIEVNMGWARGSSLLCDLIEIIEEGVPADTDKVALFKQIITAFEDMDCDTIGECMNQNSAFDQAVKLLHPDWDHG